MGTEFNEGGIEGLGREANICVVGDGRKQCSHRVDVVRKGDFSGPPSGVSNISDGIAGAT